MNSAPIDALGKIVSTVRGQVQAVPKQEPAVDAVNTNVAAPAGNGSAQKMDRIVLSPEATARNVLMQQQAAPGDDVPPPIEQVAEQLRELVQDLRDRATAVQFYIEELNGDVLIRVVNKASGEIIRQIPPEEILNLQDNLRELNGLLFDEVS